jgi:hypothetical protein
MPRKETERVWKLDPDRVTSIDEFNAHKKALCKVLRRKTDHLPFLVKSGSLSDESAMMATGRRLRALQKSGERVELLRGYRLLSVPDIGRKLTFNAIPTTVLRRADGSHETLHSNGDATGSSSKPMVFVASSRVHTELDDEQLCSGRYMLCTVVVGAQDALCALGVMKGVLSHFEQRKICMRPEDGAVRRWIVPRAFPFFDLWVYHGCRVFPSTRLDMQIAFGFPFRELTDAEHELAVDHEVAEAKKTVFTGGFQLKEMVAPVPPWKNEPRVWLPSVQQLHALYKKHTNNFTTFPTASGLSEFVELFATLQDEYSDRITRNDCGGALVPSKSPTSSDTAFL